MGFAKNTELSGEIVTPPFIASTEEAREKVVINRPKRATHDRPNGATNKEANFRLRTRLNSRVFLRVTAFTIPF